MLEKYQSGLKSTACLKYFEGIYLLRIDFYALQVGVPNRNTLLNLDFFRKSL